MASGRQRMLRQLVHHTASINKLDCICSKRDDIKKTGNYFTINNITSYRQAQKFTFTCYQFNGLQLIIIHAKLLFTCYVITYKTLRVVCFTLFSDLREDNSKSKRKDWKVGSGG